MMDHFSGDYYLYNNQLFKKIKPTKRGYYITNKNKKRMWITLAQIKQIIQNKKQDTN